MPLLSTFLVPLVRRVQSICQLVPLRISQCFVAAFIPQRFRLHAQFCKTIAERTKTDSEELCCLCANSPGSFERLQNETALRLDPQLKQAASA